MGWRKRFEKWVKSKKAIQAVPVVYELGRGDFLAAAACWLGIMAVYWQTLPPTVTGEDSGELITAAYTLGIAHPPGYPIWCLLGKLFTFIPHGTIGWRVAFMSSFWGAGTAFLAALFIIKLTRSRLAGAAAGLGLAFSAEFWEQCVISEVYSLNLFFMLLCMFVLLCWYESRRTRLLYAFAAVYGLGLCNHNTMHFLGPAFALFILSVDHRPWLQWQTYLKMAGVTLGIWLLIHLYLPIRSLADPPVDWGNPETWEGFWDVVMRQQYSFGFTKNPRTLTRIAAQLWTFAKLYSHEFTPWLAVLPALGLYPLWKLHRRGMVFVTGLFFYITLGFIAALNFNIDKESIWVNNVFFVPAYIMAALLMAGAVAGLSHGRFRGISLVPAAGILTAVITLLPLWANYYRNDKSQYWFAHDFATNILKTMEPNAVYFPVADHATFPVLYLQAVEGQRPDVLLANKYGYTEEKLFETMPVEFKTRFGKIPGEADQAFIEDWFVANTDRPAYFTRKRPIQAAPDVEMANAGLLYAATGPKRPAPTRDFWSEYTWHTLDKADTRGEFTAEAVLSDYYFFYGRHLLETGKTQEGLDALRTALEVSGEEKETLNNIGSACAEHGQLKEAEDYFLRSLEHDPDYMLSLQNLAKVYLQLGEHPKALAPLKHIVELKPEDIEGRWLIVRCLQDMQQPNDALPHLQAIAKLTPNDPNVYKQMGMIYLAGNKDRRQAQQLFAHSLKLDPNQPELLQYLHADPGKATGRPRSGQKPKESAPGMPNMPNMPNMPEIPMPEIPSPDLPELPSPDVPSPDAPMPDVPSPNVPSPDVPSADAPAPQAAPQPTPPSAEVAPPAPSPGNVPPPDAGSSPGGAPNVPMAIPQAPQVPMPALPRQPSLPGM